MLAQVLELFTKYAVYGGGLWAVWGVIVLAGGLREQTGAQIQSGMWQVIGGGMVIAAAKLFSQVLI